MNVTISREEYRLLHRIANTADLQRQFEGRGVFKSGQLEHRRDDALDRLGDILPEFKRREV